MARGIVVSLGGEVTTFDITKVERAKLYGHKERVIVDDTGAQCMPAMLTRDGSAVIPTGGSAMLYVDAEFDTVERSQLRAVGADGTPLPTISSTLGVEEPLFGPVAAQRVLDHLVTGVYQLQSEALGKALAEALARGEIYETRFNYRDDYEDSPAFLLQNDQGTFALIATPVDFEFLSRDAPPPALEDAAQGGDELSSDLDFSMM